MLDHLLNLIAEQGGSWSANKKTGLDLNENEIIVSVEDFFTDSKDNGQDFAANTGVSNMDFFKLFSSIKALEQVQGVWIEVYDYDQEEDEWPYAETCYIAATANENEIRHWFVNDTAPSTIELLNLENASLKNLPGIPKGSFLYQCWWD